jgi:enamine deaminase RidA (YjgF/YER057c/UK114 family)
MHVQQSPVCLIFIAGQTALDQDGKLVGGSDFAAQAEQVFDNLRLSQCLPQPPGTGSAES